MRRAGVLVLLGLGACAAPHIEPFRDAGTVRADVENEALLWDQSDEVDRALSSAGLLYEDEPLRAYLQALQTRLFPEFAGALEVRVLASPSVNAFTLPSGSIYVHAGLLAALASEAQLATVLAHEGVHFTHRHGIRTRSKAENVNVLTTALSLTGLGLLVAPLAASSVSGYSRDLEREADRLGFERLVRAGYAPPEAVEAFRRLQASADARGEESPLFFASHPALEERLASFRALAAGASGTGEDGAVAYRARTAALPRFVLDTHATQRDFVGSLAVLGLVTDERLAPGPAAYYRGEALRQRGAEGDREAARAAFEEALRLAPEFALTHRALGRMELARGERATAREHLARYLELAPDAPDRAHVEKELEGLRP